MAHPGEHKELYREQSKAEMLQKSEGLVAESAFPLVLTCCPTMHTTPSLSQPLSGSLHLTSSHASAPVVTYCLFPGSALLSRPLSVQQLELLEKSIQSPPRPHSAAILQWLPAVLRIKAKPLARACRPLSTPERTELTFFSTATPPDPLLQPH